MKKSPKGKKALSVNFAGVEAGGRSLPDGDYLCEVKEVTLETSHDSGQDYLKWVYKVADGKHKGFTLYDNTSLQPQALWRLRGLLEALAVDVPDGPLDLELEEYVDLPVILNVANEAYQGKNRPRVVGFAPAEGSAEVEEESEAEEETQEADAEDEDEEVEEEAASEEEEVEEEEVEEEETPPAKAAKSAKAAPPKAEPKKISKKVNGAATIKAGMQVKFEDDGDEYVGKVLKVEDDIATVKVKKDEWEIAVSELSAA